MSQTNHVYHSALREMTEAGGGLIVRLEGKQNTHKKSGTKLAQAVDHNTGQETVIWCDSKQVSDALSRVPVGMPVLIKGYGARESATVRIFNEQGQDITPPPTVAGFNGGGGGGSTGQTAGGFGQNAGGFGQTAQTPLSEPTPPMGSMPYDPPAGQSGQPVPLSAQAGGPTPTPPAHEGIANTGHPHAQVMAQCLTDAADACSGMADLGFMMTAEDVRAIAITLFIQRGRG